MKKTAAAILILIAAAGIFTGCRKGQGPAETGGPKVLHVLTTFLPMYIFTKNVTKGVPGVQVDILLSPALGCPHDYQLKPGDAKKIAAADVLIANGLIEEFLGDAVKRTNPKIRTFVSSDGINLITDTADSGGRQSSVNPHTWVSPANAIKQVDNIRKFMAEVDPAHAKEYAKNAEAYKKELAAVEEELVALTKTFPDRRIVTFHDAFDYFAKDAGLEIVGYVEASPGQEPSAGEITALIKKIKALKAKAVYSEPQYPSRVAELVSREAGVPVASLDPVSQTAFSDPPLDLYQRVMKDNFKVLRETLSR